MKKGKELKVNTFKNYNVVYGSVNNKIPKALYINISAWAELKNDGETNYNRIIRSIDKKIRQTIYDILIDIESPFLPDKNIVDFDIKESGIKFNKRSYSNTDITLFLKHEIPINTASLKPFIDMLIENIITTVFEKDKNFKFHRKKN
jgi:basic membrane lipoprotein Med (substrate-binding protein (PBP1-ABC) superfamily)